MTNSFIELSTLHELENKYNTVFLFEDLIDVDDVGMVKSYEHLYLIFGGEKVILVKFGCEDLASVFTDCSFDCAAAAV